MRVKDSFWEPRVCYTVTLPIFFHCNLFCNFLVQLNFKVLEFFQCCFFFLFFKASSIYGGNEICLQAQHSDIDVSYGNIVCTWSLYNLKLYFIDVVIELKLVWKKYRKGKYSLMLLFPQTSALLYSYQKLTEIALKFYIIEHHNSSRIGVTSGLTSDIGDTLCLLQSLLGDSEMPESVYRIRQSVTDMDISEMVPYTCRTLSQSITGLNSIAGSMRTTLLTNLNDFA